MSNLELLESVKSKTTTELMPWDDTKRRLKADQSLDEWLARSNLNWTAEKSQAFYFPHDKTVKLNNKIVIYHSITGQPLGFVSPRFHVVQPRDIIRSYKKLAEHQGFNIISAGDANEGRKIWALADTGESFNVAATSGQNDTLKHYILLATAFDGTLSTTARHTTYRIVCGNMLEAALAEGNELAKPIRIPHYAEFDLEKVSEELRLLVNLPALKLQIEQLAKVEVNLPDARMLLAKMYFPDKEPNNLGTRAQDLLNTLERIFCSDAVQGRNSLWHLVNAVTNYQDHLAYTGGSAQRRLNRNFFGSGRKYKQAAWNIACEFAKVTLAIPESEVV